MEQTLKPEDLPVVEVTWIDHTTVMPEGEHEVWCDLATVLEIAKVAPVTEVGYVLINSDDRIVIASCVGDDSCKGASVIIPSCVTNWTVLREGKGCQLNRE